MPVNYLITFVVSYAETTLLWLITINLVTIAATSAVGYTFNGYFNMSETTFVTQLLTSSSAQYVALVDEVTSAVRTLCCHQRVPIRHLEVIITTDG